MQLQPDPKDKVTETLTIDDIINKTYERLAKSEEAKLQKSLDYVDESLQTLSHFLPEGNSLVANDTIESLIEKIKKINQMVKILTKSEETIKNKLKFIMDKKESIVSSYGVELISWKEVTSLKLDSAAIKDRYPEIYKDCSSSTSTRRFLVK